jgi:hypothetical protein
MFKDEQRYEVWERIRQQDLRAFARLLPHALIAEAARRSGVPIVRSALAIPNLIWLGLLSAAFSSRSFADVLSLTVRLLDFSANGLPEPVARASRNARRRKSKRSKHDPRGKDPLTVSEEAFAQARKRMPLWLWGVLIELLTERFEAEHERLVRWKRFRLLALDGTCLQLPKWKKLSDHFGVAKNGRSKGRAQARMVMLQLPLVRLPWRYELSGVDDGERTIAERLLRGVRPDDLVLMDQGFWSYGLFHQIQAAGGYFAIRRYPGVKFKTLRRLGPKDHLVRWKTPTGPRWCGRGLPRSIDLRVIDYQVKGFRATAVVTNVLDPQEISRDEWIHMASEAEPGRPLDRRVRLRVGLYHRRWEIETTFHELKAIQGMERDLRSRTPESIQYEVAGHVLLYLLVRWLMAEAAQRAAPDGDPLGVSFKHALEELLTAWPLLVTSNPPDVSRRILPRLLTAIASHQVSWRPGRSFPRKKDNARLRSKNKSKPKKNSKNTAMKT